jgi:hypothetical protein
MLHISIQETGILHNGLHNRNSAIGLPETGMFRQDCFA